MARVTSSTRPPINSRRTLVQPELRTRLLSVPTSADPPKKPRLTTVTVRRRAASGSALSRVTAPVKSGPLCKVSHLNSAFDVPVKLEAVFGRTAVSPNSLDVHEQTGRIAYVAGASVVLTSLDGTQAFGEGHLVGAARHPFTCLAFSSCGRYMATGESGHQPHVRLWEIYDDAGNFTGQSIRSFPFHSNSVVAVRFVSGTNLLISVGCQHDGTICVWDWRNGTKVSTGKVTAVVNAIAISPDNTMCVTVGSKHVKYWHLPAGDSHGAGMQSRSAILADRRSSVFVDVVFLDNNKVLTVTEDGALVEFLNKKYVKTYRYDDHSIPLCVSVTKNDVVLGCTNGVIRLYDKDDLTMRGRLPHPAFIGMDPASASSVEALEVQPQQARYPDVRALCCTSSMRESFIAAYSDRSMFVFERGKGSDPWRKLSSSMAHVGPVTVVKRYPSHFTYLPGGSFITAGADGTVRIWNMSRKCDRVCSIPKSNLLSSTLKKIIYVEENFSALVEPRGDLGLRPSERVEHTTGIRCLTISPDGKHLVAGTKSGKLHIIDLCNPEMNQLEVVSAHENDVQCMEYSNNSRGMPYLFASGGRDRLVHLFRPGKTSYEHCNVIEDHQSALNTVRFVQKSDELYLFTCGSDKTIIIWRLVLFTHNAVQFNRENQISSQMGINDLLIPMSGNVLLTSCQDRQLRAYSLSGKLLTTVRGTGGEADLQQGSLGKFCLDPSGIYAASVCSDRHVYMVEVRSGKCLAALTGIGESATDVEYSEDCRRLYITASNGCIFVWRLSDTLVNRMQIAKASLQTLVPRPESPDSLLGSESEVVSEELQIDNSDSSSPQFGSRESLDNWCLNETVTIREGEDSRNERDGSLIVRPAQVTRHSTSNLFESSELENTSEHDESQSDFISKRRNPPIYSPSKSMINLRDMSLRPHEVLTDQLDRSTKKNRSCWGDPQPNRKPQQEWEQTSGTKIFHASAVSSENHMFESSVQVARADLAVTPQSTRTPQSLATSSSVSRLSRFTPSIPPSQSAMSQMATINQKQQLGFHHDALDRANPSVRNMQKDVQPQTVWSPNKMTPKRATSNMQSITPTGAAASAITRRQDGISESALHLRSRSQSPNQLLLHQRDASRSAPNSTSREFAELHRRRDSDLSYAPVSTRLTPASSRSNLRSAGVDSGDLRKSTEKLNRIAALRSKLHQSSENLRKSSDNLGLSSTGENEKEPTRTRSISSLKGGNSLEAYGTFDVDQHQNVSSLTHSRLLARSAGNVSLLGRDKDETPASRLQNTIDMLKKASNTDLTQCSLYEEPGSPCGEKMRRRGAVQKRVERYHPRHRAARNQTSEESDSNGSDASPLNQTISRRLVSSNNRSVSTMDTSNQIGNETTGGRRLFDQQRCTTSPAFLFSSPRRTTNYLAQKMAGEDMVGPDLGSDDSPRSSLNSYEWNALLEEGAACQQLVRHVQDCYEQLQVNVDKAVQARMLVEESSMTSEQKRVLMAHIEKMTQKMLEKLIPGTRSPSSLEDTNGNGYTPIKNPQTCGAMKTSLLH